MVKPASGAAVTPGQVSSSTALLPNSLKTARGGDTNDIVISLLLVLQLERVPCLPH